MASPRVMALRAFDGNRAAANPRDIAAALFGHDAVRQEWNGKSDFLRSRVRRAIAAGVDLVDGGYLRLLPASR